VYYRSNFAGLDDARFAAAVPKLAVSEGSVGFTESAIRVRRNFPETWLWQMLESG